MDELAKRIAAKAVADYGVALFNLHDSKAGTGFVVRRRGVHWLITAAHMPMAQPNFHDLALWPPSLRMNTRTTSFDVPLFSPGYPREMGRYFKIVRDQGGNIADMMAIQLSERAALLDTNIFAWEAAVARPSTGSVVMGYGFPGRTDPPIWPPAETRGIIVGRTERLLHLSAYVADGFSGGPIVDGSGALCGMMIGVTDGVGIAVSVPTLELLFD